MIVLVYPDNVLRNKYSKVGYATIGDYGFEVLNKIHAWDDIDHDYFGDFDIDHMEAMKLIKDRMEIWHRWVSNVDQYEMLLREAMLHSVQLAFLLKKNDIKAAIFHTSIVHHIDTMVVEVACIIAKIKLIFLYSNVIDTRLVPMLQKRNVSDRVAINADVSIYDSRKSIESFIRNKKLNKPPVHNALVSNLGQIFLIAVFYNLLLTAYNLFFQRVRVGQLHLNSFLNYTFFDHLRLIQRQRKAILFYKSNCISKEKIESYKLLKVKAVIIAAHYQPEATSFPEGWDFSNHIDMILEIRRKGYKGPILYKEHPGSMLYFEKIVGMTRVGMYRSKIYYEKLTSLGCLFLPFEYELDIKDDWYIPATITGTIALERALIGNSTLVFGYPWFKNCPNIINIKNFSTKLLVKHNKPKERLREQSISYIESILSFKTLTNSLGIATGVKLKGDAEKVFLLEYEKLLDYIKDNLVE